MLSVGRDWNVMFWVIVSFKIFKLVEIIRSRFTSIYNLEKENELACFLTSRWFLC